MVKVCLGCDAVVNDRDVYVPVEGGSTREQHVNNCKFCGSKVITVDQYEERKDA